MWPTRLISFSLVFEHCVYNQADMSTHHTNVRCVTYPLSCQHARVAICQRTHLYVRQDCDRPDECHSVWPLTSALCLWPGGPECPPSACSMWPGRNAGTVLQDPRPRQWHCSHPDQSKQQFKFLSCSKLYMYILDISLGKWVSEYLLLNVTINDISVIYVTQHRCAGGLKKKDFHAINIS